jgi:hypothetical protein
MNNGLPAIIVIMYTGSMNQLLFNIVSWPWEKPVPGFFSTDRTDVFGKDLLNEISEYTYI